MTPNQQYKDLGPDDVIQENDQFFIASANTWHVIQPFLIGERVRDYFDKFRRPIPVQEVEAGKDAETKGDCERPTICPQCNESITQLRSGENYCEECGWPDENREHQTMPMHDVDELVIEKDRLQRENEELRKEKECLENTLVAEVKLNSTLRTQLDKAGKALEKLREEMKCLCTPTGFIYACNRCRIRKEIIEQTLADIKKGTK